MEEFTFPCVPLEQCSTKKLLPVPHVSSPPPPWLVAGSGVDTAVHDHRRAFSAVEQPRQAASACPSDHDDHRSVMGGYHQHQHYGSARYAVVEEDKMDMLWEDFNEELARAGAPPPCPLTARGSPWTKESWLSGGDDDDGCAPAAETPRRHAVVRRRRMGILMMLRLLKKLFLAHKSGGAAAASRKVPPI